MHCWPEKRCEPGDSLPRRFGVKTRAAVPISGATTWRPLAVALPCTHRSWCIGPAFVMVSKCSRAQWRKQRTMHRRRFTRCSMPWPGFGTRRIMSERLVASWPSARSGSGVRWSYVRCFPFRPRTGRRSSFDRARPPTMFAGRLACCLGVSRWARRSTPRWFPEPRLQGF